MKDSPATAQPQNALEERIRALRPLRGFLVLWVALIYIWSGMWGDLLSNPLLGAPVTALMLAHAAGHWFSLNFARNRRWLWSYLAGQCALVLTISIASHNPIISFLLFTAQAGETVLLLGEARLATPVALAYLAFVVPRCGSRAAPST
jgi:hypothetical protein